MSVRLPFISFLVKVLGGQGRFFQEGALRGPGRRPVNAVRGAAPRVILLKTLFKKDRADDIHSALASGADAGEGGECA